MGDDAKLASDGEANGDNSGRRLLPREVWEEELKYIARRRGQGKFDPETPPDDLVGLALSGGGIRAATFALGALQELGKRGVLPLVDYLCTVSGGGFTGACLSSLLSRPEEDKTGKLKKRDLCAKPKRALCNKLKKKGKSTKAEKDPYLWKPSSSKPRWTTGPEKMPLLQREIVHHLRNYGDFVIPRRGFFKLEVIRTIGTVALGLAFSFLSYAVLVVCGVSLLGIYYEGVAPELVRQIAEDGWLNLAPVYLDPDHVWVVFGQGAVGGLVALAMMVLALCSDWPAKEAPGEGELPARTFQRRFSLGFGVLLLILCLFTPWVGALAEGYSAENPGTSAYWFWMSLAVPTGATSVLAIAYPLLARTRWWRPEIRSVVTALTGTALYCLLLAGALLGALVIIGHFEGAAEEAGAGSVVSLAIIWLVSRQRSAAKLLEEGLPKKLWGWLLRAVLTLVAPMFILTTFVMLAWALWIELELLPHAILGFGVLAVLVLAACVDFNRMSLHHFYSDRLADAFLRTEATRKGRREVIRDDREMLLVQLHGTTEKGGVAPNPAPYHLLSCALNLSGSRDLSHRDRQSDHFIFSRCYVGSTTTGYVATGEYLEGKASLATAMALSGAAVSSGMGAYGSFAQAFAMTLFNVRLGLWLDNPVVGKGEVFTMEGTEKQRRPGVFGSSLKNLWPWYIWRELMGHTDATQRLVYLSDGGHTGDNVGVYPLLQRRCRLVIAVDASRDPHCLCTDLVEGIRQINTDENVQVEIDIRPLVPEPETGLSPSPFVVGRVAYPDAEDGWLVYIKASSTGREGATCDSYRRKVPDFPHQTTADQFFDEQQFEAYRCLGVHVASEWAEAAIGAYDQPRAEDLLLWCESVYGDSSGTA